MVKKILTLLIAISFITGSFLVSGAYAKDYGMMKGYAKGHGMDMTDKFFKKASFILWNAEELGLSENQIDKIESLKYDTKKDLLMKEAEIDVIALDIKRELRKDSPDTSAINKLLDKKYDLKKEKTKKLVSSYVDLKSMLTDSQMKELKSKWKMKMKKMTPCGMMGYGEDDEGHGYMMKKGKMRGHMM